MVMADFSESTRSVSSESLSTVGSFSENYGLRGYGSFTANARLFNSDSVQGYGSFARAFYFSELVLEESLESFVVPRYFSEASWQNIGESFQPVIQFYEIGLGETATATPSGPPIYKFISLEEDVDMSIEAPTRVQNIISHLSWNPALTDQTNANVGIVLYTPSTALIKGKGINFFGFITEINVAATIRSLPFAPIPAVDDTLTLAEKTLLVAQLNNQPRMALRFYLQSATGVQSRFAEVPIFAADPLYQANITAYLTKLEVFGIGAGTKLMVDVISKGWGVLAQNDTIDIYGSILEKSNYFIDPITAEITPVV